MEPDNKNPQPLLTAEQLKSALSDLLQKVVNAPYELNEIQQKRLMASANCAQKLYNTLSGILQWENASLKKDKEIKNLLQRLENLEQNQIRRVS